MKFSCPRVRKATFSSSATTVPVYPARIRDCTFLVMPRSSLKRTGELDREENRERKRARDAARYARKRYVWFSSPVAHAIWEALSWSLCLPIDREERKTSLLLEGKQPPALRKRGSASLFTIAPSVSSSSPAFALASGSTTKPTHLASSTAQAPEEEEEEEQGVQSSNIFDSEWRPYLQDLERRLQVWAQKKSFDDELDKGTYNPQEHLHSVLRKTWKAHSESLELMVKWLEETEGLYEQWQPLVDEFTALPNRRRKGRLSEEDLDATLKFTTSWGLQLMSCGTRLKVMRKVALKEYEMKAHRVR